MIRKNASATILARTMWTWKEDSQEAILVACMSTQILSSNNSSEEVWAEWEAEAPSEVKEAECPKMSVFTLVSKDMVETCSS